MFKYWISINEALGGYLFSIVNEAIMEGRSEPEKLRDRKPQEKSTGLYPNNDEENVETELGRRVSCKVTPLSAYKTHIEQIQKFANSSPENMAQVMMFSPLSANCTFSKHWDNFQVLMLILKHYFPEKVNEGDLSKILDGFCDYLHALKHTVGGWKLDTICQIWNDRQKLFTELPALAKEGDDTKLISRLCQIKGVQPVKAGFIAQLLFGKAGCIDTHNIDIFSKVFPDLKDDLNPKKWAKKKTGVQDYVSLLGKLKERGIGSEQLWNIWVDFVENFYKTTSPTGLGTYADMGPAYNYDDPIYAALQNVKIPKNRAGRSAKGEKKEVDIPVGAGLYGMGASATHLPVDSDELLNQFHRMYNLGEPGSDAARAVPYHKDKFGRPLDPLSGMGLEPSMLKYFGHCLTKDGKVDPNCVQKTINTRIGNVERKRGAAAAQTVMPFAQ